MLRAVLDQNLRRWEDCLPHAEFAYNHATHSCTKMRPFQIVYGYIPRAPIDLFSFDTEDAPHLDVVAHVEQMFNLHEQTHQNIAAANAKYQVASSKGKKYVTFESGDMVWLHLRKDRFPTLRRSKLMPHVAGPFKVLTKINDNAYILDLLAEFGVSTSFNLQILSHIWVRMRSCRLGRLQYKKGRMMRTPRVNLHQQHLLLLQHRQHRLRHHLLGKLLGPVQESSTSS
jgi:hypothetical protein